MTGYYTVHTVISYMYKEDLHIRARAAQVTERCKLRDVK